MNLPFPTILRLPYTSQQILKSYMYVTFFSLFPFFVSDLALLGSQADDCLYYGFNGVDNFVTGFTLGSWLAADGYIKLAMIVFVIFMNTIATQLRCKTNILAICGNIIRIYWLFNFGWTITCCALFWSIPNYQTYRLYQICNDPYQGYIFTMLLINYVLIPINFVVGSIRSQDLQKQMQQQQKPFKPKPAVKVAKKSAVQAGKNNNNKNTNANVNANANKNTNTNANANNNQKPVVKK